jgi:hypothetical protein
MKDSLPNKIAQRKSKRGKIRRKKKIRERNCPQRLERAAERHSFTIYSGQNWLGSVEQRGDQFTARTNKNKKISVFDNLKAAADAVSNAAEAA